MIKVTPEFLGPNGLPMRNSERLVVATIDADGVINTEHAQLLTAWNHGKRNAALIARAHGWDLMEILTRELGLVRIDIDGRLNLNFVRTVDPHVGAMRLLGKIAEALIVRRCNTDVNLNRAWGTLAWKRKSLPDRLDNYVAVGTGLETTKTLYPTKYLPGDTQRDIIWIERENPHLVLMQHVKARKTSGIQAGLQIKVSRDGMTYLKSDILEARYEVPLVYFDLNSDYDRVANAIYKSNQDAIIGVDFCRGHSVDPECHELLRSYYHLCFDMSLGTTKIDDIFNDDLLFDSFTREVIERSGAPILVV
jgi:hypothetical protein